MRTLTTGLLITLVACTSAPSMPTLVPTFTAAPTSMPAPTPTPTCTATLTPTPTPSPTPTPTLPPTETPLPSTATPEHTPQARSSALPASAPARDCSRPASPHSAINGRRMIAYYGTTDPGLGILGRNDVTTTLALLAEQAQPYRELDPCVETVLVFHIVSTIADAGPGEDGDYNHRVPHESLQVWIDAILGAGGLAVLDIQPGRSPLTTELSLVEPLLRLPGVHLAVDPEFIAGEEEIPGRNLGHITGEAVNEVQAWLDGIAEQVGEHKILVVHQFEDRMVENKDVIQDYPLVDLVWDADGFGGPWAKIGDYHQYRDEAGFEYGGIKLFYDYDVSLLTPAQVMGLDPPPAYVIYQ